MRGKKKKKRSRGVIEVMSGVCVCVCMYVCVCGVCYMSVVNMVVFIVLATLHFAFSRSRENISL